MPPRIKKATPPADLADKAPANGTDLDALRAEVAAEPDADDGVKVVPLGDTAVRVKHYLDWPASADELLIAGRLSRWAEKIVVPEDYAGVWQPMDPTNRQVVEFITSLEKITGIPFGVHIASPAS